MIVFTICSNNYLAQAITLGNSLLIYNPSVTFIIGLVDKKNKDIDYSLIPYEFIPAESIDIPDFEEVSRRYGIVELNTSVKPYYFRYFFSKRKHDTVVYLDPDIRVYSAFTELENQLLSHDIIITPHFTTPIDDVKLQTEEDFLKAGLYNLGFIAIKRTNEGSKMINWWADRLYNKAYINFERGLFTDQKWINFVPLFFKNVKILTNPGYNMAYWNLHERKLSMKDNVHFVNEVTPLAFYHFSGFNPLVPLLLSKYQNRFSIQDLPEIEELFKGYSNQLFLNGYENYIGYPNVYAGIKEKIEREKRKEEIRKIPLILRVIRILILKVSSKYKLLLD